MQPVLIFYQLSHGQDPDWILGDCVGIALPTFLPLILGIRLVKKDGIACDSDGEISNSKCYSSVIAGVAILALDKIKRTGTDKVLPLCELVNWVKVTIEWSLELKAGSESTRTRPRFELKTNYIN